MWEVLFVLSAIIGIGYPLACIYIFNKIPTSISATHYYWQDKNPKLIWLFQFWAWGTMFTISPFIFSISNYDNLKSVLGCLTCCALFSVGFFPKYRDNQPLWHYLSAGLCAIFAMCWAIVVGYWLVPVLYLPVLIGFSIWKKNCTAYFAEMTAFISIYTVIGVILCQDYLVL